MRGRSSLADAALHSHILLCSVAHTCCHPEHGSSCGLACRNRLNNMRGWVLLLFGGLVLDIADRRYIPTAQYSKPLNNLLFLLVSDLPPNTIT